MRCRRTAVLLRPSALAAAQLSRVSLPRRRTAGRSFVRRTRQGQLATHSRRRAVRRPQLTSHSRYFTLVTSGPSWRCRRVRHDSHAHLSASATTPPHPTRQGRQIVPKRCGGPPSRTAPPSARTCDIRSSLLPASPLHVRRSGPLAPRPGAPKHRDQGPGSAEQPGATRCSR